MFWGSYVTQAVTYPMHLVTPSKDVSSWGLRHKDTPRQWLLIPEFTSHSLHLRRFSTILAHGLYIRPESLLFHISANGA
jgi:hypothetical protein